MYKGKSKWIGAVLAMVMVLIFTTPIFAQGEVDPVETPEMVEESSKFLDNPIVNLIAEFFNDLFNPPVEEQPEPEVGGVDLIGEEPESEEPLPSEEPLGVEGPMESAPEPEPEPEPELEPVISPEEAVAAMREEENLGNGEIVKLMGIVEGICAESGENCGVTLDNLLAEYEDDTGMGELFDKYGKPEQLGVGQIRKESNPVGQVQNKSTNSVKPVKKTNNGKAPKAPKTPPGKNK